MADTSDSANPDTSVEEVDREADSASTESKNETDVRRESELVALLSKPISSDSPAGEHDPYDGNFESVKTEINKISDADYKLVVDLSTSLLGDRSKNLLVCSYLTIGLAHTRGVAGLEDGLAVVNAVAKTFWEDAYPPIKRMAVRQSALHFFAEKTSEFFQGYRPAAGDRPALEASLSALSELQTFTMERMGDNAPTLSGLKRVLEDIQRRLPKPAVTPVATGQSDNKKAVADGTTPAQPTGEIQSESDARAAVMKAVGFLREKERSSATACRVIRALRWSPILSEPPNETSKTRLPVPVAARRSYLTKLNETGEHEQLVAEAEASFQEGTFHFWLDLQRLVAVAMDSLGKEFDQARSVVLEETALLLRRVPSLPDLTFSDGTPFADALTIDWIDAEVRPLFAAEGAASPRAVPRADTAALDDDRKEAEKALRKGDLSGAINVMRKGAENDRSAKDRFYRQLTLAELCMKGNRPAVARPILEDLDKQIEVHGLDVWEPDLALSAWSALHSCYKVTRAKTPAAEKEALERSISEVFEKICRVDASFALTLPER